ncbi:class I SAM-dependent methyltransferase [Novosphingobium aquae]|uniref:Methyltransferase domain-containing protein n=1 Tax=Novosphingobium aquae TaxID=3133435 RepID=A0ABU8SE63_9SPHN
MSEALPDYGWGSARPHTANYLSEKVRDILRESGGKSVLDAGCGNGALAGYLASLGYQVTGLDASTSGIEIARMTFPDVRFEVGTFDSPPTGTFDAVCSTEVVEHLYSPHLLIQYCFEALKPGGLLIISTPYHGYLKNLAIALLGKWDSHLTALWHGGHIKFWSRATLSSLLEGAGFEVTGFYGAGRLPFFWKSMIIVAKRP